MHALLLCFLLFCGNNAKYSKQIIYVMIWMNKTANYSQIIVSLMLCVCVGVMSTSFHFTETLFFYGYMNLSSSGQMPVMEEVDTSERLEKR